MKNETRSKYRSPTIESIHERMPVILAPQNYELWLDPSFDKIDSLQAMLAPDPAAAMQAYPVSSIVNSPKNVI